MVERADVAPEMIVWARRRSRITRAVLRRRFPKLDEWEKGSLAPTVKQLEAYARATHASLEWFERDEPPLEKIPIPDRRAPDVRAELPSADVLDTIEQCLQRQAWYRSFARSNGDERVAFVGSMTVFTAVSDAAARLREAWHFEVSERGPQFTEATKRLTTEAEEQGVLVMVNGVVGSNTHRRLNPDEFRGFAVSDRLAPVVFVNGSDPKAAQSFTLPFLLAHLALGETALCSAGLTDTPRDTIERWCHAVTLELLAPLDTLREAFRPGAAADDLVKELARLAKLYKVSTLVVLRRLSDAGFLGRDVLLDEYDAEVDRLAEQRRSRPGGGNFYNTQPVRMSKRFTRALLSSTLEGRTAPKDATRMLGFSKPSTLNEMARRMGVDGV